MESAAAIRRYLDHRKRYEIGFWITMFSLNFIANTLVVITDLKRAGLPFEPWDPALWEGSSALMQLLLIPLLLRFDARFPLGLATLRRHLPAHLAFTVVWSLAHVSGMVLLREVANALVGRGYDFGPLLPELFYEYLKDFRSYFSLIALIYLYRFVLLRLQGEARFLAEGRESEPPAPVTDRFLVKKLGREFLVKVEDIDWIEAAGNYVNLHVAGRLYPLRETMTAIEGRLREAGFSRVHRSAIVNLDRVAEIEPFESGDARARLATGELVPVSRRYRAALRAELR